MELASGMFAALAGWAGGWLMGFGALLLWLAGVVAVRKFPLVTSRDGVTLIEVVIAVGLLVAAMIPMLNLSSLFGGNSSFYRQVGVSIATSKVEELGDLVYRTADGDWGGYSDNVWYSQPKSVGGYSFTARWRLSPYSSQPLDGDAGHWMKQVVVVVTCNNCPRNPQPVRVSTYLEKLPQ